ncbi:uncharacterized protein BDR25DRAFT_366286 [Lindgomyces ingoldianus]|uniref:Uncharacterized protein n=1 Tax=Lindgomyces ingoldianus TaxID=673940 RepID=A0ACB6R0G0_9PLEO|nr:uncharacterized protein BDR25DRAFT_366286 [Lindgomyces ingoldianus]KAF2472313.1 hypothetical protein BDR25DRAFT_366286 [Lindgomyces ingoldianus]
MEPFSALAVAAACIQFIDFTAKVVTRGVATFNKSNSTSKKDELALVADHLRKLNESLGRPGKDNDIQDGIFNVREACNKIESDLTSLLDQLKSNYKVNLNPTAHGTSRRWASVRHALLSHWGDDETKNLERKLDTLRQELILNILVELRQQSTKRKIARPIGQEFLQQVDEKDRWQKDLVEAIMNGDAFPPIPTESSLDSQAVGYFLDSLMYDEMFVRHGQISDAFYETFKWLFEEGPQPRSWADFREWLCSGDVPGIYWISAKPGSGKSTLVKYIASHEQTEHELRRWAGETPLVQASFYFWSGGSDVYKSRESLLKALLVQIFKTRTELIPRYCPRRAEIHRLFGSFPISWGLGELDDVIQKLVQDKSTQFFFLIDGLDECIDNHEELVSSLQELANNKNVKICLSSRPWPDFEDAFKDGPHLMLHELTEPDIKHYVQSKLDGSSGFAELKMRDSSFAGRLVDEITKKSQGVFLWVQFVVRAILSDLRNRKRIEILESRLQELPEELEDLFQTLIDMVEDDLKEDAYELFELNRAAHAPITLLTLSFAHEEGKSLGGGKSSSVTKFRREKLGLQEKEGRCRIMKGRLMSHCKGLLEVVASSGTVAEDDSNDSALEADNLVNPAPNISEEDELAVRVETLATCTVHYMHRTVKDFLKKPNIWKAFNSVIASSSFDPYAALCRASIIHLKTFDINVMRTRIFWAAVTDSLHYAALSEIESQNALVTELDELDKVADEIARMPWPKEPSGNIIKQHIGIPHPTQKVPQKVQNRLEASSHWSAAQARGGSKHSFLCLTAQYSLCSYVKKKIEQGTPIEQVPESRSLLDCVIRDYNRVSDQKPPPIDYPHRIRMIELLLEYGDDPHRIDSYRGTPWMHLQGQIKSASNQQSPKLHERRNSKALLSRRSQPTRPPTSRIDPQKLDFWFSTAELFVKYRPNCWGVDIKGVTGGALKEFDEERAAALEKAMKKTRRSLSQIWSGLEWRRSGTLKGSINGSPTPSIKT